MWENAHPPPEGVGHDVFRGSDATLIHEVLPEPSNDVLLNGASQGDGRRNE
jgi:hypothetical protein